MSASMIRDSLKRHRMQQRLRTSGKAEKPRRELPEQLSNSLYRLVLSEDISYLDGVVKTWRQSSKQCGRGCKHNDPWLERNMPLDKSPIRYLWEWEYYLGYPVDMDSCRSVVVTQIDDGTQYHEQIIITGFSHPAFLSCHYDKNYNAQFMEHDCAVIDPNAPPKFKNRQACMQFTNAITTGGKIYALSLQGTLAVIELFDSKPVITSVSKRRAVPTVSSKHFAEYMITHDGKLFLVFLICHKSIMVVDSVEVFRLEFQNLSWVKTDSLAGQAIFVGPISFMLSNLNVEKAGCRRNSVYFTRKNAEHWWVFDMESASITAGTKSSKEKEFPDWV